MRARSIALLVVAGLLPFAIRPPVNPNLYSGLVWRNIGPFRGGRVSAVTGVIGQPGIFYIGLPLGGVWKTTGAGTTWYPIFDDVKEASSVGSVQVAPSIRTSSTSAWATHHRWRHQRGQRRLQVDGRRKNVEAHGARRHEADSVDPRRPEGSEPRPRSPRRGTSTRSRTCAACIEAPTADRIGSRRSTSTARPAHRRSRGRSIIRA